MESFVWELKTEAVLGILVEGQAIRIPGAACTISEWGKQ
jgi:hypothetical protein